MDHEKGDEGVQQPRPEAITEQAELPTSKQADTAPVSPPAVPQEVPPLTPLSAQILFRNPNVSTAPVYEHDVEPPTPETRPVSSPTTLGSGSSIGFVGPRLIDFRKKVPPRSASAEVLFRARKPGSAEEESKKHEPEGPVGDYQREKPLTPRLIDFRALPPPKVPSPPPPPPKVPTKPDFFDDLDQLIQKNLLKSASEGELDAVKQIAADVGDLPKEYQEQDQVGGPNPAKLMTQFGIPVAGGKDIAALSELGKRGIEIRADKFNEQLRVYWSPMLRNWCTYNASDHYKVLGPFEKSMKAIKCNRLKVKDEEGMRQHTVEDYFGQQHYERMREEVAVDYEHFQYIRGLAEAQAISLPFTVLRDVLEELVPSMHITARYYAGSAATVLKTVSEKKSDMIEAVTKKYDQMKTKFDMYDNLIPDIWGWDPPKNKKDAKRPASAGAGGGDGKQPSQSRPPTPNVKASRVRSAVHTMRGGNSSSVKSIHKIKQPGAGGPVKTETLKKAASAPMPTQMKDDGTTKVAAVPTSSAPEAKPK